MDRRSSTGTGSHLCRPQSRRVDQSTERRVDRGVVDAEPHGRRLPHERFARHSAKRSFHGPRQIVGVVGQWRRRQLVRCVSRGETQGGVRAGVGVQDSPSAAIRVHVTVHVCHTHSVHPDLIVVTGSVGVDGEDLLAGAGRLGCRKQSTRTSAQSSTKQQLHQACAAVASHPSNVHTGTMHSGTATSC